MRVNYNSNGIRKEQIKNNFHAFSIFAACLSQSLMSLFAKNSLPLSADAYINEKLDGK